VVKDRKLNPIPGAGLGHIKIANNTPCSESVDLSELLMHPLGVLINI
jgi:hypothetical protein